MNKKIWSKGKLKQGVICLGDILVRSEFPCTEISLSCLSLIMTRSHAAEPWEGTTTLLVKRDLHNISISLFGLSSMCHYMSLMALFFHLLRINRSGWLWFPQQKHEPNPRDSELHTEPAACLPQGLLQALGFHTTPGKADPWEWILPLQLCPIWAQSREWIPAWLGAALQSPWAAGTGQEEERGHEFLPLHCCGHRKDLKPHLGLNQSLEGKEEGRNHSQTSPSSASPAQRGLCSIFTLFPPSLHSQTRHHLSPGQEELSGIISSPLWWERLAGAAVCHPSPPSPTGAPSGGQQTPKENSISLLRVTETNVAATAKQGQELELTWSAEWTSLQWAET